MILTHFGLGLAGSPCSFRDFLEPQCGQKRPKWTRKRPYAAGKMLAKCIFGHKNTLCQPVSRTFLFLECRGGWASFQCKILATACLCAVPFHGKPHYGTVHSVSMVWQTIWCDWLVRPCKHATKFLLKIAFILLSFYPFIPVIYLVSLG